MNFTDDDIIITPLHEWRSCGNHWQSCDYSALGVELFHERTVLPWSCFKPLRTMQWFGGLATRHEIEVLAERYGGHAEEDFYPADPSNPLHFLAFSDTEKALAFCRTDDFDRLCLPLATTGKTAIA